MSCNNEWIGQSGSAKVLSESEDILLKLHELCSFPEPLTSLKEYCYRLAALLAKVLDATHCSITLFAESSSRRKPPLHVHYPHCVDELCHESEAVSRQNGADKAATREGLDEDLDQRTLVAPLRVDDKEIGRITASGTKRKQHFNSKDLKLLSLAALMAGKSIQVIQLQNILNSRFTQIALANCVAGATNSKPSGLIPQLDRMARIVAKSFYREMTQAGFSTNQIIQASSELLSELNRDIRRGQSGVHRLNSAAATK